MSRLFLPLDFRAEPLLLLLQLRRESRAQFLRLEHLTNLDLGLVERGALEPFDGFFLRVHLPQPEAGDQLLGLGERAVNHDPIAGGKPDSRTLGARMESLGCEHHAGFHQLFVELPHIRQDFLVRQNAGLAVFVGFDQHHESHRKSPSICSTSPQRRQRSGKPGMSILWVPLGPVYLAPSEGLGTNEVNNYRLAIIAARGGLMPSATSWPTRLSRISADNSSTVCSS